MRQIHDHKVNGLNEAINIIATDGPGPGGANHRYLIHVCAGRDAADDRTPPKDIQVELVFQNGPIVEAGFNGISNEALLAIVIDRMRGFQHQRKPGNPASDGEFDFATRGQFACRENACALTHLEEALMWLQKRTNDRLRRGVEGTHKV